MTKRFIIISIVIIAVVVGLAAAFASGHPDGLEWVAEKLGFIGTAAEEPQLSSPLPDYAVTAIKSPFWSTTIAGILGAAIVAAIVLLIGRFFRGKDS
jgi:hypothetical protein